MSKAAKRRFCPAVQREITSAECGENRVSRYPCPADCAFNPFAPANYDSFSEIEGSVIRKSMDWFLSSAPDRAATERQIRGTMSKPPADQHAFQISEIFCKRDGRGLTFAQRWEAAGFPNLKNDERVTQRAAMQMRICLIEVHRVIDDLRVEVVDLLEPQGKPFLIFDRGMASQACRFSTLLGWYFPLPHFWRCSGYALHVQPFGEFDAVGIVSEIVRHLGGPAASAEWMNWFGDGYGRFSDALQAVGLARREQMLAGVDAEFGKAVYELRAPFAQCREDLDANPAIELDVLLDGERDEGFAEARVWFASQPDDSNERVRPVLGRVLLGQAHWRVEAMGAEKLRRLRDQFEGAMGHRVRFAGERRDNLAAHLKAKEPKYDRALVPPRLLENPMHVSLVSNRVAISPVREDRGSVVAGFLEEQDRAWLEDSVPALSGKTPREAAQDPALRPALVRLLKERVRATDERNLEAGSTLDCNWMLRELGFDELIFDPPPARAALGLVGDEPMGNEIDAGDFEDDALNLPRWPPLPPRSFTKEEAMERLSIGIEHFKTASDAMDSMEAAGCFLLEDLPEVLGNLLNEEDFSFLVPSVICAWFAFAPPGYGGPVIETEEVHQAFSSQLERLERVTEMQKTTEESGRFLLEVGPQPALMEMLGGQLLHQWDTAPRPQRPTRENLSLMLVVLKTVVELLDAKCRSEDDDIVL